jgi:SOS-response transcriptional repressor LexA
VTNKKKESSIVDKNNAENAIDEAAKQAFCKRFHEALDLKGYPPMERGRAAYVRETFGLSRAGAFKWLEGRCIPHPSARRKIAKELGVNIHWLDTGTGSPSEVTADTFSFDNMGFQSIPLLSLDEVVNFKKNPEFKIKANIAVSKALSQNAFAVVQAGQSMSPKILEESVLIIDPAAAYTEGDIVLCMTKRFPEAVLRQYVKGAKGVYFIALNGKFDPLYPLEDPSLEILGKGVEMRIVL